jgi:hypothetical protein
MRNRHVPRLCRNCAAPMAGDENTCWRCGVEWAIEGAPPTTLRLIPSAAPDLTGEAERWTNEGGSFAAEVTVPLAATAVGS